MKKTYNLFLFFLPWALSACGQNEWQQQAAKSQVVWKDLKKEHNDTYQYTVAFESWVGFGWESEIFVEKGKVVQRTYRSWTREDPREERQEEETYSEVGAELGDHRMGAPLKTLDELYSSCIEDFLTVDPEENSVFFSALDNELLGTCGFVPLDCADDCFEGIKLSKVTFGESTE